MSVGGARAARQRFELPRDGRGGPSDGAAPAGDYTVESASATPAGRAADASDVFTVWQDSVVALWTPTTRASGFVIDRRGFVATSEQVVGAATSVEGQLTPSLKVMGAVLAADCANDVAILWIDAEALTSAAQGKQKWLTAGSRVG